MTRWIPPTFLVAVLGLAACGGDDPAAPRLGQDPVDPPPTVASGTAVLRPLPDGVTSRRFDLQVAIADSGDGVARVAVWARPAGGVWQEAFTVSDTMPTRFTVPEEGPFGDWEFAAQAVAGDGTREVAPELAEALTAVPQPIFIEDRRGETWEVTHAVLRYGMGLHSWENGIGRHTIAPLIDPPMACAGDPDYPDDDNLTVVLGVTAGDEARAYRLGDLIDREVVDDTVAGTHLAVTY